MVRLALLTAVQLYVMLFYTVRVTIPENSSKAMFAWLVREWWGWNELHKPIHKTMHAGSFQRGHGQPPEPAAGTSLCVMILLLGVLEVRFGCKLGLVA